MGLKVRAGQRCSLAKGLFVTRVFLASVLVPSDDCVKCFSSLFPLARGSC